MKRLLLICAALFLVSACSMTQKPMTKAERMLLAEEAGANNFWWRNGLIGGGSNLDGIDDASLVDGDGAFVVIDSGSGVTEIYPYVYDETGTTSESSPSVIAPDSGTGRWYLSRIYAASLLGQAADGSRYFSVANTSSFPSSPLNGWSCYRTDMDAWFTYDSGTQKWIADKTAYVLVQSANTLVAEKYCFGGTIICSASLTLTLKNISTAFANMSGMDITIKAQGAVQVVVDPDGSDNIIKKDGTELSNGVAITGSSSIAGCWVRLVKYDSNTWMVISDYGTWN